LDGRYRRFQAIFTFDNRYTTVVALFRLSTFDPDSRGAR